MGNERILSFMFQNWWSIFIIFTLDLYTGGPIQAVCLFMFEI